MAMKIGAISEGRPKLTMADITREFAVERLGDIISFFRCVDHIPNIKEENKIKPETYAALEFAIADMKRVEKLEETDIDLLLSENIMFEAKIEELEAENKRLKEGIANVKAAATETLIKFHEDCIQVARENLLESHVEEVGRIFAAVLIGKPYDQVTRDEVDAMLTAPEEDEDEEI